MKLSYVLFQFTRYGKANHRVVFDPDDKSVLVYNNEAIRLLHVDNSDGSYKPCVTHATELLKLALQKTNTSNFAKRRAKAMKPKLKVRK